MATPLTHTVPVSQLFPELQLVYSRLQGIPGSSGLPHTVINGSNNSKSLQINAIGPDDLAITVDRQAAARVANIFNNYQTLINAFNFLDNLASINHTKTSITLSSPQHAALGAYIGIMEYMSGSESLIKPRIAILEGVVRSVMDPDHLKATPPTIKAHMLERWPSTAKLIPSMQDLLVSVIVKICEKHNLHFDEKGFLDIQAIDKFIDEVLPMIQESQPSLVADIKDDENRCSPRHLAMRQKSAAQKPPADYVRMSRADVEALLSTVNDIPNREKAARNSRDGDVREAHTSGRLDANKELRAQALQSTKELEYVSAFTLAPSILLQQGFEPSKNLLIKRMAILISTYFPELFGDRDNPKVTSYVDMLAARLVTTFLQRELKKAAATLSVDILCRAEWTLLTEHFPHILNPGEIYDRFNGVTLPFTASKKEEAQTTIRTLMEEGLSNLASLLAYEADSMHAAGKPARNILNLSRREASTFDGNENKKQTFLKALKKDDIKGVVLQGIIEAALDGNPHCLSLLASNDYVIDASEIAWDKDYSNNHITANQLMTLVEFGNYSAAQHLMESLNDGGTGYLKSLTTNPDKPFSVHPRVLRAYFVLAIHPDPAINDAPRQKIKQLTSFPTLASWKAEFGLFEAVYGATSLWRIAYTIRRVFDIGTSTHFSEMIADLDVATIKLIANDPHRSSVSKRDIGAVYKKYLTLVAEEASDNEATQIAETMVRDDSQPTIAREVTGPQKKTG